MSMARMLMRNFISVVLLLSVMSFYGCRQTHDNELELCQSVERLMQDDSLSRYDYIVIIPQEGCEGCISFGEDFYETYKTVTGIKFIFTNIVSEKKLRKRIEIAPGTIIDKKGVLAAGCKESDRLYPTVINIEKGKVEKISRQSPEEDALIELEQSLLQNTDTEQI